MAMIGVRIAVLGLALAGILSLTTGMRLRAATGTVLIWRSGSSSSSLSVRRAEADRGAANTDSGWIDLESGVMYRRASGAVDKGKRRPPVPITPRLLLHLRRWRRDTTTHVIEYAGRPINSKERRAWRTARELAGLGADVTPHVLRHTCATMLLQLGVSVYDVAGVLGASENVIRRTYGHHAHDRHAVAAFSRRPSAHEMPMKSGNKSRQTGKISPNSD